MVVQEVEVTEVECRAACQEEMEDILVKNHHKEATMMQVLQDLMVVLPVMVILVVPQEAVLLVLRMEGLQEMA